MVCFVPIPEYSCDDFMMSYSSHTGLKRSVYECVCEFNRKVCSFCCRQVKKEMRRNGLDWIVSYRIEETDKKPFSDTKRPKTRIIAVFAVFFSLD